MGRIEGGNKSTDLRPREGQGRTIHQRDVEDLLL